MPFNDAVLLYDLKEFCELSLEDPIFASITHLYFRNQLDKLIDSELAKQLLERLKLCTRLIALNVSKSEYRSDELIAALTQINLPVILNIRQSKLQANEFASNSKLYIIDDNALPFINNLVWTKFEYYEMLLVALAASLKYPDVVKFSRKRFFDLNLPLSVIFSRYTPIILVKDARPDVMFYNMIREEEVTDKASIFRQVRLGVTLHPSIPGPAGLQKMHVKVQNANRSVYSTVEVYELNGDRAGYSVHRPLKDYTIQPALSGASLSEYLDDCYRKQQFPSLVDRVTAACAMVLAVLTYNFRGKVHRDLKPHNTMRITPDLMELVDFESTFNCMPDELQEFKRYHTTAHYDDPAYYRNMPKPPIGHHVDAYGLGLVLRQILVAIPYVNPGTNKYHFEVHPDNINVYREHREYYDTEMLVIYGEEFAGAINGLINPNYTARTRVIDVFEYLRTQRSPYMQTAIQARFLYKIAQLQDSYLYNSAIRNWFDVHAAEHTSNHIKQAITEPPDQSASNTQNSISASLHDLIIIELLMRTFRIIELLGDETNAELLKHLASIYADATHTDGLSMEIAAPHFYAVEKYNNKVLIHKQYLANAPLKIRNLLLEHKVYSLDDPIIRSLGVFQNHVRSFLARGKSLIAITRYLLTGLTAWRQQDIRQGAKNLLDESLSELNSFLTFYGDENNKDLSPPTNPLLFLAPNPILRKVPRFYSLNELFANRHQLFVVEGDPAELSELLILPEVIQRRINFSEYKACPIYLDILYGNRERVESHLPWIRMQSDPERLERLLRYAFETKLEQITNPSQLEAFSTRPPEYTDNGSLIFAFLLEHVVYPNKSNHVKKYLADLIDTSCNYLRISLLVKYMCKRPEQYTDYLKSQLLLLLQTYNTNAILTFVKSGVSPLMNLGVDLSEPTCDTTLTCKDQPYKVFRGCQTNLLTYAMFLCDYQFALEIVNNLIASKTELSLNDTKQLGFHLVVAARNGQKDLCIALVKCGADLTCKYPLGWYRDCTAEYFAYKEGYLDAFIAAKPNTTLTALSTMRPRSLSG